MKHQFLFLMAAFSVLAVSCGHNEEVQVAKVQVVPVVLKDSVATISLSYPATLRGVQDVAIYPQVSGRIVAIYVKEGQYVRAGQTLFAIDDIPFTSAKQVALANLEMAKAGVQTAQLTYDSKKNLYDQKVISEYQLKLAYNSLLTAKASEAQAQAELVKANNDLSFTKVHTMVSGYVGSLPYKLGSLVSPSITEPLTIVSDNSSVYADFSIPENAYLNLQGKNGIPTGKDSFPLSLVMNNGEKYGHEGHIHSKEGMISDATGALPIRSIFPNPDALLLSGGSATVVLTYTEPKAILIPRTAMKEVQDKLFVFQVKGGKIYQTGINASRYDADSWILMPNTDGTPTLAAGDTITSTVNRLIDGSEVEIIQAQTK